MFKTLLKFLIAAMLAFSCGNPAMAQFVDDLPVVEEYTHPYKVCEQMTNDAREYSSCVLQVEVAQCTNFDRLTLGSQSYTCHGAEERAQPDLPAPPKLPPLPASWATELSTALTIVSIGVVLFSLAAVLAIILPACRSRPVTDYSVNGKEPTVNKEHPQ